MREGRVRCPLCESEANAEDVGLLNDGTQYNCPNCGEFGIVRSAIGAIQNRSAIERARISYWVRFNQGRNEHDPLVIHNGNVETILAATTDPSPSEKADRIILWIGMNSRVPGQRVIFDANHFHARIGAVNMQEVRFYFESLEQFDLVKPTRFNGSNADLAKTKTELTFKGWARYAELQSARIQSRRAFMAMEFNQQLLESMFATCFKPAVLATGYHLEKVSVKAEHIDRKIEVEIRTSRFVLADLTHKNNGAYWEAGFAHGIGKPVIYTCREDEFKKGVTHFDTRNRQMVIWNEKNEAKAAEEIKAIIRASILDPDTVMED